MIFTVLTRIYYPECIYLNCFIEYYLDYLKFNQIYFIITDNILSSIYLNYINNIYHHKIFFYYHNNKNKCNFNGCLNIYYHKIDSDYILTVDSDEFIYLKGFNINFIGFIYHLIIYIICQLMIRITI